MSAERLEVYKCQMPGKEGCDCLVEMLEDCQADCCITCCDQAMTLLEPKGAAQEGKEKHVPVIEKVNGGYKVKVGSTPHPMEAKHWIQWIELHAGNMLMRQYLNPGDAPEATFKTDATEVVAREHCNVHGLWKS